MDLDLKETNITLKSFTCYVQQTRYNLVPAGTPKLGLELLAISNALGGEVGELQNIVKKIILTRAFYAESDLHDKFVLEAGDALHYLCSLIQIAGYNIEHVMACNVQKLDARKQAQLEAQDQAAVFPSTAPQPRA